MLAFLRTMHELTDRVLAVWQWNFSWPLCRCIVRGLNQRSGHNCKIGIKSMEIGPRMGCPYLVLQPILNDANSDSSMNDDVCRSSCSS